MILELDNKGAVDLVNNYSMGGRTRHMETRQYYYQGKIVVKWTPGSGKAVISLPRTYSARNSTSMLQCMLEKICTWETLDMRLHPNTGRVSEVIIGFSELQTW